MPRYKLTIEYDGTAFAGWQVQDNGPSIQGELARAVAAFSGENTVPKGAGRTDAGVHARGQAAHLDLAKPFNPQTVSDAINAHLGSLPISVLTAEIVDAGFDARFSAIARHYEYRIINRRARPAIDRGRAWHVAALLDVDAMASGAFYLTGRHDFTTFRSVQCQGKSPIRTLDHLTVTRDGDTVLVKASARSFLHRQVRSIAGSLKRVGEGKWQPHEIGRILEARDRSQCGPVAPACGLYLMLVDYPPVSNG